MNIALTIRYLVPDAEYVLVGNEYDGLTWLGPGDPPTLAELEAASDAADAALANGKAREARAKAYQREADPLFFDWQRGEGTEQAWLEKVQEIRDRHPYS